LLQVDRLTVTYGPVVGVKDVSFSVGPGELLAVLGPNGAGKTSMLEAIAGRRASSGRVLVDDADFSRLSTPQRLRRGLTLVPQGREILKELTVDENLTLAGCVLGRREARTACERTFDSMPILAPLRRRKAGYLSGGEQQSLAVARAILAAPSVLLLDEPSFGLSPALRAGILDWVARERDQRGLVVVLAEQFTDLALRHAKSVLVLSHGEQAWAGPAEGADPEVIDRAYFV
jgi:ABC-type branched-subunit amino acid transport system ATPase component